jgi:crotonobetainyl-CoA:carnitine CoA-transferase CaiB-like acyl-CoA transferase
MSSFSLSIPSLETDLKLNSPPPASRIPNHRSEGGLLALTKLLKELGIEELFDGEATLVGIDPIICSRHRLAEASGTAQLLLGASAASIWRVRTGNRTGVRIEAVDALHALHSAHYVWQMGKQISVGSEILPINGFFRCSDGRSVLLCAGPPYMKLLNGFLDVLGCAHSKSAVAGAIAQIKSESLVNAMKEAKLPCAPVLTREEWLAHPQGRALAMDPVIEIEKIADGEPVPFPDNAATPLDGIRVLDFTHVLAGPHGAQSLAEFGAEVLHISDAAHADTFAQHMSVNFGKYCAYLDLNTSEDTRRMRDLEADADVFINSYRSSVLQQFNLLPQQLASRSRRGIVAVSINAYGHHGPWSDCPGFDPNGQAVSGFSAAEGSFDEPAPSPVFYLNDLLTGYLAAAGAMAALVRRSIEGGSYNVKVSLTRSAMWVQELGLIDDSKLNGLPQRDIYPWHKATVSTRYGSISQLKQPLQFSNLKLPLLDRLVPPGADPAQWN